MPRSQIDAAKDSKLVFETSESVTVVRIVPCRGTQRISLTIPLVQAPTFDALGLKEDLLRGIYAYGESGQALPVSPSKLTYVFLQDSRSLPPSSSVPLRP